MKTFRPIAIATAFALATLATTALAQDRRPTPNPQLKAAFQELRTSMRTWRTTAVIPHLREWKAQYDASLSPADLSALNALRARAATLRQERRDIVQRIEQARRNGNIEEARTLRASLHDQWEKRVAIVKELRPIAERSRAKLEEIGSTAKPQLAAWRSAARQIVSTWFDKNRELLADNPFPHHAGRMARSFWPEGHGAFGKRRAAVRFMLWDGGDIDEMEPHNGTGQEGGVESPRLN